ncbi:MAG: Nif3-like dinuclear metal center hexameric protein [Candidatus Kryptoniota bacterium]
MKVYEVINRIENSLPIRVVEDEDNVGLIAGSYNIECTGLFVTYELNYEAIERAVQSNANLVVTYHTPIYKPTKKLTSSDDSANYLLYALNKSLNVYSVHTAIDISREGINFDFGRRLGLKKMKFLSPLTNRMYKISVFVPSTHVSGVRDAMSAAGAGVIGDYVNCSFESKGKGTFLATGSAHPFVGVVGVPEETDEVKLEMIVDRSLLHSVLSAMVSSHPYEEVAYDVYPLANPSPNYGFGVFGELDKELDLISFLSEIKEIFDLKHLVYSAHPGRTIKKVAFCAGSGMSFYRDALKSGADIYITGDVRYHDFRQSLESKMILVDATHYGTEKYVPELLSNLMLKIFGPDLPVTSHRQERVCIFV